ncbi:hypothetical protein BgAZ_301430 [Babesia gibsoni]|uniref:MACPF domain-containing protein n=1 Tax=Babesia gibsoni TaxID=33632 RepID=A0AAD8LH85_BABGI|nr:hypothetical protein BgAZ_301430 [Babesia gibsoni]
MYRNAAIYLLVILSTTHGLHAQEKVDDPESPAGTVSDIKFTANSIVTGLEYLGSGFDAVKSNTTGSIDNGEDLGHRAPIVDFYWSKSDIGVTNSLAWLQPVGGWVRPIIACGETQTVEQTEDYSNNEDIKAIDIGIDVSLQSGHGGKVATGYHEESMKKMAKSSKIHKSAYYCFTYAAGMPPYLDWDTTEEFHDEMKALPKDVSIFDKCTISQYRNKEKTCDDVSKWMEFFSLFGTHVTTEIHLGGRIIRYLTVPNEALKSFSKAGFNAEIAVKTIISGALAEANLGIDHAQQEALKTLSDSCELTFSVLGGIHVGKNITPSSILKWKATVPRFPMPIKMTVTPMDHFLGAEYEHVYKEAMDFYVTLNNALPWFVQAHNGIDFNLKTMVTAAYQMIKTGAEESIVTVECPKNKKILFGFILDHDMDSHRFKVTLCPSNSKRCTNGNSNRHQTVIWVLCGNAMGLNIVQKLQHFEDEGTKTLSCAETEAIITGFALLESSEKKQPIKKLDPCKTGATACKVKEHNQATIWIVCVDKRFPGLENASTMAKSYSKGPEITDKGMKSMSFAGMFKEQ